MQCSLRTQRTVSTLGNGEIHIWLCYRDRGALCRGLLLLRFRVRAGSHRLRAMPLEMKLAHLSLNAKIDREAPKSAAFHASDTDLQNAANLYRQHCSVCHGLPDGVKSATQKGMYPVPPLLLHGKGVTDDPPGESYWKVKNGIRLTGMPAYGGALSEKDLWSISELLAGADKLPGDVLSILNQPMQGH